MSDSYRVMVYICILFICMYIMYQHLLHEQKPRPQRLPEACLAPQEAPPIQQGGGPTQRHTHGHALRQVGMETDGDGIPADNQLRKLKTGWHHWSHYQYIIYDVLILKHRHSEDCIYIYNLDLHLYIILIVHKYHTDHLWYSIYSVILCCSYLTRSLYFCCCITLLDYTNFCIILPYYLYLTVVILHFMTIHFQTAP